MHSPKRESPFVIFLRAFPPQIIAAMVVQIALINGALMIGGVFLGLALDRQFGTRPLLTLALPIFGALLSVLLTYHMAMRTVTRSRKAYLDWVEAQRAKEAGAVAAPGAPSTKRDDARSYDTRLNEI